MLFKFKLQKTTWISLGIILIATGIFILQNKQFNNYITNLHTATMRLNIWENSIQMSSENFLMGVGAGNWQIYFPKYGLDKFDTPDIKNGILTYQRPHNDFLWVLCENGIFGIIVYISIFIAGLYYLFKLYKCTNEQREIIWISSFLAGIIGYMSISFADFPMERIEHQILLFLILSIITSHYYNSFQKTSISKKGIKVSPFISMLFYIIILISSLVSVYQFTGEFHSRKIYNFQNKADWNNVIKESDLAINYFYELDPMSAPIEWYKGVAYFTLGNIPEAKTCFEKAYAIHPNNIHVINNLASCFESMGNHIEAKEKYLQVLSISSEFEESRLNLSAVYYNLKEFDNAFQIIDKVDVNSKDPKYQSFLPAILTALIDQKLNKEITPNLRNRLNEIKNSKENLIESYVESKNKNVSFEDYIFNKLGK